VFTETTDPETERSFEWNFEVTAFSIKVRDLVDGEPNPIAYWDFDFADAPDLTFEHVFNLESDINDAKYTEDKGGHTGEAGDYAMDFLETPTNMFVQDGEVLDIATSINKISFSVWVKNHATSNATVFWANTSTDTPGTDGLLPPFDGRTRVASFHIPWGNENIYFDTAGCCDTTLHRIVLNNSDFSWDEWHHYAFVMDEGHKSIWIDGELFHEGDNTLPLPHNSDIFSVGSRPDLTAPFKGIVDDLAIFASALTEEQIIALAEGNTDILPEKREIEVPLPDIPLLLSKSPTGAAAEGEETEISLRFRGIDFTDLSITVNDKAVDPTITVEGSFTTITANGAFSLGKNVITVSWNGESETWNYYQFSVAEGQTGLASYSVETVGAVPGPWAFEDGVWVSDGSVAGCGGPYHDFLTSPDYTVSADGEVTLSFEHRHAFEGAMWDSGQLWISVNGDAYADVGTDAFSENGYTDVAIIGNGIAKGQNGFGNTSAGHADGSYITTIASLGSFAAEDAISVRFVALYDDCSTGAKPNWVIASVSSDQMAIESIAPIVSNGSFEADDVPEWPGYGAITAWTGGSGINDGGPFGDNGVIPDGAKLGFIQGTKALSQQLTGLEAGAEYVLAFYYNARNCCGGTIGFTVSVGGEELGSVSDVEPVGGENAYNSASYYFVAAGTEAELVFSATAAGDATLLLDAVSVSRAGEGPAETPAPAELPWSVGLNDDGWPAGDGGGPNTTFVQEKGANELPGNPASPEVAQQGDDDYYWAGLYSTVIAGNGDYTPVGLVEANEESAERAFAGIDNDLRYHFNLPESLEPTDRLTVSYDALNLHTGEADSRYGIEVYVNNVQVQSEIVIREAELGQTYATDPFTLADVNAEVGSGYDNIITLKGVNYNAEGGGNWMGIDYVQLSQAGGAADAPALSVVNNGNGTVTITFEGTLQAAPTVNGPWENVDGASPLTIPADQAQQYGRAVTE